MKHGLRLGGVFIANNVDEREGRERFSAGAIGLFDFGVGVAQHRIQIDSVGRVGAAGSGVAARLTQNPDHESDGQRTKKPKDHAEENQLGAFKLQSKPAPDDESQINQEDEYPNQYAFHRDTSERLVDV